MIDIQHIPAPLKRNAQGWPWEAPAPSNRGGTSQPKISVVLPSYYRGDYLEETLRSIFLQDYPNTEVIVIDGGSPDTTVQILKHYDGLIAHWESKKDKGRTDGINKGLQHCTGDIVTFRNSDDLSLPGAFKAIAQMYAETPDAGAYCGGFHFINHRSEKWGEDAAPYLHTDTPADITLGPPSVYRMHQAALFYTREALDNVGRYVRDDLKYTTDRELLYRIVRKHKAVLTTQTLGTSRKHHDTKSTHDIRPAAEEWAMLHRDFKNGNPSEDRKREEMARYWLYRSEVQIAKLSERKKERVAALLKAAGFRPAALWTRSFIRLVILVLFNKLP